MRHLLEASGQSQWFERMLAELGQQVWIGDAAKIRATCERKHKTDWRDAELPLRLLAEDRFPQNLDAYNVVAVKTGFLVGLLPPQSVGEFEQLMVLKRVGIE